MNEYAITAALGALTIASCLIIAWLDRKDPS